MTPRRSFTWSAGPRLALFSIPVIAGWAASSIPLYGQEALQTAIEEDRSLQIRRRQAVGSPMPLQWGPVGFSADVGLRVTYDDNVLLQDTDPEGDIIVAPTLGLAASWPITDRTTLSLGVGLSYDIYLNQTRPNTLSIVPASNSELAADFQLGQSLVTVYDNFSFQNEYSDRSDVRDHSRSYGTFDNVLGARILWAPEPLLLESGYGYRKILVTADEFAELNRGSQEVFFRLGHIIEEQTRWGVEATGSATTYDEQVRNDFAQFSIGPYVEWQATEALNLSLHGGWSSTIFDETGSSPAPDELSVPYLSAYIRHQLTASLSHTLSGVRQVIVGIDSEYVETAGARYEIEWQLSDTWNLASGLFFDAGNQPLIPVNEEFSRFGGDLRIMVRLTDQLESELAYRYFHRESNLTGGSSNYDQNLISAALRYTF